MDYRTALDAVWIAKIPAANPVNLSEIDAKLGSGVHQKYLSKIRAGELLTNEELQFAEEGLSKLPEDVQLYVIKGIAYALTENSRNYLEDMYPNFKSTMLKWLEKLLNTSERGRALARIAVVHAVRGEFVEAKQRYAELLAEPGLPASVATEISMRIDAIGNGAEEFVMAKAARAAGRHLEAYQHIEKYRKVASNGTELFNRAEYKNLRAQILVSAYNINKDEKLRQEAIKIIEEGKAERDSK